MRGRLAWTQAFRAFLLLVPQPDCRIRGHGQMLRRGLVKMLVNRGDDSFKSAVSM